MRRVPAIVACLLATLLLATPALAASGERDLRVATTTRIDTLNPLVGQLAAEYRVWALNFDILIAFDAKTMQPDRNRSLASGWGVSEDGLTWTYTLRRGLLWSDGRPLTARDVVWTMNFVRRRVEPASLEAVKKWEAPDDHTVVAHLSHRSVQMNALWIYILPEHVWRKADNKRWQRFMPPRPLVGSGPYVVTRWNPDGTTVMKRNPHFRRANAGPQRVLMTYYGAPARAVTDLEQNRLDVLPSDTLDVPNVRRLQRTSGVRIYRSPAIGLEYWVFNLAKRVTSRVNQSVVQSHAIRTALAWAIDRTKLVQASLLGYGAPGNTQLSRSYGRYTLDLSDDPVLGYHYDPSRARRILEQAGWELGVDGVRAKDGVRATLELAYSGEPSEQRAVALIRSWARDVGIEIAPRVYSTSRLIELELNEDGNKLTPDFDTELWSIGGDPTPEFLLSLFTKDQIGDWNDSGWVDKEYEQLYQQEVRAADPASRLNAIHSLQRLAAMNLPYIELYEADEISAVNTRTWSGWTTQPSPTGQPISSYGYDTVTALRPAALASPSYPGVLWAFAGVGGLAALALGSAARARRRERREPSELAEPGE